MFWKNGVCVTLLRADGKWGDKYYQAHLKFPDGYECSFGNPNKTAGGKILVKRQAIAFIDAQEESK
jgi:hypothetical protein